MTGVELGIVGTKGFVGGFPGSSLPDFGERLLRAGVRGDERGGGRDRAGPAGRVPHATCGSSSSTMRRSSRRSKASRSGSTPSSARRGWRLRSPSTSRISSCTATPTPGSFEGRDRRARPSQRRRARDRPRLLHLRPRGRGEGEADGRGGAVAWPGALGLVALDRAGQGAPSPFAETRSNREIRRGGGPALLSGRHRRRPRRCARVRQAALDRRRVRRGGRPADAPPAFRTTSSTAASSSAKPSPRASSGGRYPATRSGPVERGDLGCRRPAAAHRQDRRARSRGRPGGRHGLARLGGVARRAGLRAGHEGSSTAGASGCSSASPAAARTRRTSGSAGTCRSARRSSVRSSTIARCAITTRNPETGERDFDTLRAIRGYRGQNPETMGLDFGVFGTVVRPGHVRVGDPVQPL